MVEFESRLPICPYCDKEISGARRLRYGADEIFYVCPKCGKILSIGHTH